MFTMLYCQIYRFCGNRPAQRAIGEVTRSLAIASIIGGLLVLFPAGFLDIPPSVLNGVVLLLNAIVLSVISISATSQGCQP